MFFIIKSSNPALDLKLHRTKRRARSLLILYPMGATEALLNHYLIEKYNKPLMQACQAILTNMVFVQNMQQEIIAKIPGVDGAFVGGASLDPTRFAKIVNAFNKQMKK